MPTKSRSLPALPAKAPRAPDANRYREQFGVILICPDEGVQKTLYEAMAAIGACRIRVVTT